jgi:hypothetical protein
MHLTHAPAAPAYSGPLDVKAMDLIQLKQGLVEHLQNKP